MEISWLGHSCFQLRGKNVTLITDPFSPQQGRSLGKVSAPIVTISHNHPGHNYASGVDGEPRVVRGPGEYEISDVLITGVASYHDDKHGQELGRVLQEEQLEEVADADLLLVPIGGQHTINAAQAAEVISQVEPHIVIPMHYSPPTGDVPNPLDKFCREMGIEAINPQPKLSITRSALPAETQVVILSTRS